MNIAVVKAGFGKVIEKKGNMQVSEHYEALFEAQKEA
jgi:hypothetical protein